MFSSRVWAADLLLSLLLGPSFNDTCGLTLQEKMVGSSGGSLSILNKKYFFQSGHITSGQVLTEFLLVSVLVLCMRAHCHTAISHVLSNSLFLLRPTICVMWKKGNRSGLIMKTNMQNSVSLSVSNYSSGSSEITGHYLEISTWVVWLKTVCSFNDSQHDCCIWMFVIIVINEHLSNCV